MKELATEAWCQATTETTERKVPEISWFPVSFLKVVTNIHFAWLELLECLKPSYNYKSFLEGP